MRLCTPCLVSLVLTLLAGCTSMPMVPPALAEQSSQDMPSQRSAQNASPLQQYVQKSLEEFST